MEKKKESEKIIQMIETNISFYLKSSRVHIYIDTLRGIGNPNRICFMLERNGKTILLTPYKKRDLKSHMVPSEVYKNKRCMEISSIKLCRLIANIHSWNLAYSYRVPGRIDIKQKVAVFDLTKAEIIMRSITDK